MRYLFLLVLCFCSNFGYSYDWNHGYSVKIEYKNYSLFHNEVSFKNKESLMVKSEDFIDNCIVYRHKLKNFYSTINNQLYSYIYKDGNDYYLNIKFLSNESDERINLGDCFIDNKLLGEYSLKLMLPIFSYNEVFYLKDKNNINLKNGYSIIVERVNLN